MRQSQFRPGKNDFFFACLITAMFAVTVVGVIAGTLDLVRGRAETYAKTRGAPVALHDARGATPQAARAGPGRVMVGVSAREAHDSKSCFARRFCRDRSAQFKRSGARAGRSPQWA
jgi:hypothetical protein